MQTSKRFKRRAVLAACAGALGLLGAQLLPAHRAQADTTQPSCPLDRPWPDLPKRILRNLRERLRSQCQRRTVPRVENAIVH